MTLKKFFFLKICKYVNPQVLNRKCAGVKLYAELQVVF